MLEKQMITLENITVAYPNSEKLALDDVSLHIKAHETVTILGGSGAGKSTVLKAILRLNPLITGRILIDGEDCAHMDPITLRRTIGMVFQGIGLFPHMNIRDNVGLVLKLSGNKPNFIRSRVEEVLELVGLPIHEFGKRYPHQLSGGQQQRVGVARALAPSPSYLLMDEPFGALDAITRRAQQDTVKELRKALSVTILFVTHDVMEAVSLGDQLAVMDQGKLLQVGKVRDLMDHPASDVVEALVGKPLAELSRFVKESVA
jgi:osmoprotectant transport system ATP-binding protein